MSRTESPFHPLGIIPWRWPVGFFLRRSDRGRVSIQLVGDWWCFGTESPFAPYALKGAVRAANMKPQGWERSIGASSLPGLQGRSATGQNGQAAANKEVSAVWSEGWMSENISGVPAGRSVFHLTSPFIGLTENCPISQPPPPAPAVRIPETRSPTVDRRDFRRAWRKN